MLGSLRGRSHRYRARMIPCTTLLSLVLASSPLVVNAAQNAATKTEPPANATAPAVAAAAPTPLDRFKALKGTWEADMDGDSTFETTVEYSVIAAGSAVAEKLFPGTEHEMITMYHMNGTELMCTHYCAAGNQPRLKGATVEGTDGAATVTFTMKDITNLATPEAMYMNGVTFTFAKDRTVTSVWTSTQAGKPGHEATFRMKRRA